MLPAIATPLRSRDFALLSLGSAVSLLGDGFFVVALALQVYQLSNVPTALSLVSLSSTLPLVVLLLLGGAVSDRFERRRVLVSADLVRACAIGIAGLLAVSGRLQLWHLFVLMPCYGAASAFFFPASVAIIPETVPAEDLAHANALNGSLRSMMLQILGPALGGVLVGIVGPGPAILFDAGSFLCSAAAILAMRCHARPVAQVSSTWSQIGDGLRFAATNAWCGATLLGYSVAMLATRGPVQVLLPFVVKNTLHAGAPGLGVVLSAGGVGAIAGSLLGPRWSYRRRRIALMCLLWAAAFGGIAAYALMHTIWQGVVVAFALAAFSMTSAVIWYTLMQTRVPRELLGRVSSVDATVSFGLLPISFALTGPLAELAGAGAVFVGGGILGGLGMAAPLLLPAMRAPENLDAVTH
jgi:DHA3 family tetracycline resistance protein-like MFS transporter